MTTADRVTAASQADRSAYRAGPVDEQSRARLADGGLDYRRTSIDGDDFAPWLQSVARGFLEGERSAEQIASARERSGYRRLTGVYDPAAPVSEAPVATIASWIGELSVPGGAALPACAISAVTVAPTHRRRGIARAMLEGELRAAADAGIPMAMLTVSESTLYGRYGFAPAAASASWRIETRRATWIGPRPDGRVDFISRETLRGLAPDLHERVRLTVAGEIDVPGAHWDGIAGTTPTAEKAGEKRAIQYTDGADAYAALWRFLLELDLVAEVNADELSVDEPLLWMIADQRAATITLRDHQYVRILDVAAALEVRRYGAPGVIALDVSDALGHAEGRYLLEVDAAGAGRVRVWEGDPPAGAVEVSLGIEELSAVYLGGVSLATLAAAGRVRSTDAAAAARVLSWHTAPRLSIWY